MKGKTFSQFLILFSVITVIATYWSIGRATANGEEVYRRFTAQSSFKNDLQFDNLQIPDQTPIMDAEWQTDDADLLAGPVLAFTQNVTASLAVTKQANPGTVQDGAYLTYTIHITNTGSVTLTTTITDILPSQIITPTGTLTWTPIITPGDAWTDQFTATVQSGYTGTLVNMVEVSTQEGAIGRARATVCVNKCKIYLPIVWKNRHVFDFEDDFQGWGKHPFDQLPLPGQGVTRSTKYACSGDYSLRFDDLGDYDLTFPTTGTTKDVGVNFEFSDYKRVTACVYLPSNAPSIPVVIYVQDSCVEPGSLCWFQSEPGSTQLSWT